MKFSIISIGTEINLGLILNKNSKYIAERLSDIGMECNFMITVRDNIQDIMDAIKISLNFSKFIIVTGGLGPTDDDLTREAIAKLFNCNLVKDDSLDETSLRFLKYVKNDKLAQILLRQSYIPEGSIAIKPNIGSASGFIFSYDQKTIIAIPGVPREMEDMFENNVIPFIKNFLENKRSSRLQKDLMIKKRVLYTTDISESQIEFLIKDIKNIAVKLNVDIGVTAQPGLIKLLLIAKSEKLNVCEENLEIIENKIKEVIGENIYGIDDESIGASLKRAIISKGANLKISAAESVTGGLISNLITDEPSSSEYFVGSIISYSNFSKEKILGIDTSVIKEVGAVSSQVCIEMAKKAKNLFNSDYSISATGIAGPTTPERGKDIGLVFCGIAGPNDYEIVYKKEFIGTRKDIKFRTAQFIINKLRLLIEKN